MSLIFNSTGYATKHVGLFKSRKSPTSYKYTLSHLFPKYYPVDFECIPSLFVVFNFVDTFPLPFPKWYTYSKTTHIYLYTYKTILKTSSFPPPYTLWVRVCCLMGDFLHLFTWRRSDLTPSFPTHNVQYNVSCTLPFVPLD